MVGDIMPFGHVNVVRLGFTFESHIILLLPSHFSLVFRDSTVSRIAFIDVDVVAAT